MSTFTTIIHPTDGRELQIKCGWDECETFRLGDEVGQRIYPDWAGEGYLLDGVYDSMSYEHGQDDWVVILGGRIAAFEPKELSYEEVRERHGITDPDESLWAEEAWAERRAREEAIQKEMEAFKATVAHLSPAEQAGAMMAFIIRQHRDTAGLLRKAIIAKPMDDPDPFSVKSLATKHGMNRRSRE
jgi:hypothetical protein